MQSDSLPDEVSDSTNLSAQRASIYYLGSAVFAAGIVLIVLGSALVMYFQIRYTSDPVEILYTILSIATGITLILVGINLMIRQTKKGYAIVVASIFFSSLAIYLFYTNYLHNFYYPLVSYIFGLYVLGFLFLLGNAFASVIVWIIGNRPDYQIIRKEKPRLYSDEEIQRDIEEATEKSLEFAVAELQFELEKFPDDMVVGKYAPKTPGNVIRIKDNIDEVLSLRQTLTGDTTEKWGSLGVDKASRQLAKTISQDKIKKSRSARRKKRSAEKKLAKRSEQAKKKKEIERKNQEKIEAKRKEEETRKNEEELKKRKIEEEHTKKIELKKAQKETKIREKKAKENAIMLEKKKKLETKKALKEEKLTKKNLSKNNKK